MGSRLCQLAHDPRDRCYTNRKQKTFKKLRLADKDKQLTSEEILDLRLVASENNNPFSSPPYSAFHPHHHHQW